MSFQSATLQRGPRVEDIRPLAARDESLFDDPMNEVEVFVVDEWFRERLVAMRSDGQRCTREARRRKTRSQCGTIGCARARRHSTVRGILRTAIREQEDRQSALVSSGPETWPSWRLRRVPR